MPGIQSIIVGVDGSDGSRKALRWAHEEARVHRAQLTVVAAWERPVPPVALPYDGYSWSAGAALADQARDTAEQTLNAVLRHEAFDAGVDVVSRVAEGSPIAVLIELAEDADLIVVGSRGHGGFMGLLLGSVSQHLATHARCPVLVVH